MTSITALEADRIFRENNYKVVNSVLVSRLFKITNQNTVYKLLQRLTAQKVLKRAVNGTYFVSSTNPGSFCLANSLITPSYISFESALNYYGILPQFPYPITSSTTKRSQTINFDNREFSFRHLATGLYFGFVKTDDFLIATPEKAVLDLLYFKSKGLASADISDWDTSVLNKRVLKTLAKKFNISIEELL
jgi:predicted transcriptional regulator of viral defense system